VARSEAIAVVEDSAAAANEIAPAPARRGGLAWHHPRNPRGRSALSTDAEEMGPIDYLVIAWPGRQPTGEAAPLLVDLVERGIIRVLDLIFITKAEDGSIAGIEISEVGQEVEEF
jgi:hypothetical protein